MNFHVIQPSPTLKPYVAFYWTLEGESGPRERIFPDGCVDLVVQLGQVFDLVRQDGRRERQSAALLAGQLERYIEVEPTGRVETFGIRFRPSGAHLFLRFPLDEIKGRIVPLDDVWPRLARGLAAAESTMARIQVAERALEGRLREAKPWRLAGVVERVVDMRVARLAHEAGISPRHLDRVFRERVGLAPKTLARILRFQRALRAPGRTWAEVAAACGYFDQAHMIRDFREFAGIVPTGSHGAFLQDTAPPPG